MANTVGKNGKISDGTNVIGELRGWSIDESAETIEDTAQGDGDWRSFQPGIRSWAGSCSCFYDKADLGQIALSVGAVITGDFYPDDDDVGDEEWSGSFIVSGLGTEIAEGNTTLITRSITFQGSGALTKGTKV